MHSTIAVILAGGTGSRLAAQVPKQLLEVAGRSVLAHTLAAFRAVETIHAIAIVAHADWQDAMAESLSRAGLSADYWIAGGADRASSTEAALHYFADAAHLPPPTTPQALRLLFHDAARCLVTPHLIGQVCAALDQADAVNVLLPPTDSLVQLSPHDSPSGYTPLDRSQLRCVQTPQGFRFETLRTAYERFRRSPEPFAATDDCGIVRHFLPEARFALVDGEAENLKITFAHDLVLAEHLLRQRS